jgi:hypothetical protein
MIRKIIVAALFIFFMVIFYNTFMKDTLGGFFRKYLGQVDFLGKKIPEYKTGR